MMPRFFNQTVHPACTALVAMAIGLCGLMPDALAVPVVSAGSLGEAQRQLADLLAQREQSERLAINLPYGRADEQLTLAGLCYRQSEFWMKKAKPLSAQDWLVQGDAHRRRARLALTPSRQVETRAMLLDASSIPKSEEGVAALVARLADANFNLLIPEVYRRGYTIYRSDFTERDPEFRVAPDVLAVLIREAHRRGVAVHPWIWTFRARSPGYGNPLLGRLPAIAARKTGKDARFISPASRVGRALVTHLVDDLSRRYAIDGLMLDYIRYDEEIPDDQLSREKFARQYRKKHGRPAPDVIVQGAPEWLEWQLWREEQVHQAVAAIARRLRANRPNSRLSAAVFRGESYARLVKMQHWRHWSNNRWIDWPSPMLYTSQVDELKTWLERETDGGTRKNWLFPILGVHRMNQEDALLEQWSYLTKQNSPGALIFAMSHMDGKFLDSLKQGLFREPAMLPNHDVQRAIARHLADLTQNLATLSHTEDLTLSASAEILVPVLTRLRLQLERGEIRIAELGPRLNELGEQITRMRLDAAITSHWLHQLDYAQRLVDAETYRTGERPFIPTSLPRPTNPNPPTGHTASRR